MTFKPVSTDQLKAIAQASRNVHVKTFVEDWLAREMEELPYALVNPTLKQGRCQVLLELKKLMELSLTHTG